MSSHTEMHAITARSVARRQLKNGRRKDRPFKENRPKRVIGGKLVRKRVRTGFFRNRFTWKWVLEKAKTIYGSCTKGFGASSRRGRKRGNRS